MTISSYKGLLRRIEDAPSEVRSFFGSVWDLVNDQYRYEIAIAYMFLNTENAHHRALYGGAVRIRRVDKTVAINVVNAQHMNYQLFLQLFENIFGHKISKATRSHIDRAQKVRNRVIHGKTVTDAEMRNALVDLIEYAESMNAEMEKEGNFKPFGDMRGFKGRAQSLDKETSRWLMKGLGFTV